MRRLSAPKFRWKGTDSDTMGVYMVSMPTRGVAVLNGQKANNLGRDGFTFYDEGGYGAVTIKCDIVVPDNTKLNAALAWLSGRDHLVFSDESSYYWDAMVMTTFNRSSPAKRLEGQQMTITWTCQPFRYILNEAAEELVFTANSTFQGKGHVPSRPLVKVEGASTADAPAAVDFLDSQGQHNIFNLILTQGTPLYIDCEAKAAYTQSGSGKVYAGDKVMIAAGADWWELRTDGNNYVAMANGVDQVTVTPRWRFF